MVSLFLSVCNTYVRVCTEVLSSLGNYCHKMVKRLITMLNPFSLVAVANYLYWGGGAGSGVARD